ncbi:uncharacterized protein LOC142407578 [Mycteria americana]|uniref:uncharacterized protein LOC142407578 n=1 Tax=Mycteria americana TaxID=33587 RepID=UPI003F586D88
MPPCLRRWPKRRLPPCTAPAPPRKPPAPRARCHGDAGRGAGVSPRPEARAVAASRPGESGSPCVRTYGYIGPAGLRGPGPAVPGTALSHPVGVAGRSRLVRIQRARGAPKLARVWAVGAGEGLLPSAEPRAGDGACPAFLGGRPGANPYGIFKPLRRFYAFNGLKHSRGLMRASPVQEAAGVHVRAVTGLPTLALEVCGVLQVVCPSHPWPLPSRPSPALDYVYQRWPSRGLPVFLSERSMHSTYLLQIVCHSLWSKARKWRGRHSVPERWETLYKAESVGVLV